jgi:hypothetical protein
MKDSVLGSPLLPSLLHGQAHPTNANAKLMLPNTTLYMYRLSENSGNGQDGVCGATLSNLARAVLTIALLDGALFQDEDYRLGNKICPSFSIGKQRRIGGWSNRSSKNLGSVALDSVHGQHDSRFEGIGNKSTSPEAEGKWRMMQQDAEKQA